MDAPGHIVLIGLMGTGKSTVGSIVAGRLGLPMIDNDAAVEAATGKTVRQLWEEGGEDAYRKLESAALLDAIARSDPHVIAAAGGVVLDPANRAALDRLDNVVWLHGAPDVLAERALRSEHRPLLAVEPEETMTRLAGERDQLYRDVAELNVDVSTLGPEAVAEQILTWLEGSSNVTGHVVLVGMMGSGKTTVGRRLASRLDRLFVDADDAYEARFGHSIADAFATIGELAFRDGEVAVLDELLAATEPTVIAVGGGVVVTEANRRRLAATDVFVVWMHGSPAFLASRAKAKVHRPLLADGDIGEVLDRLYTERQGWYREVADHIVDIEPFHDRGDTPKETMADRLAELVRGHEARGASDGVRA